MRIRLNETGKDRSLSCDCLHNNIVVESLVVVLTVVSALAVTGEILITFNLITVPQYVSNFTRTSGNGTQDVFTENADVLDVLLKVFHYTSMGIAGLFFVEIFFKFFNVRKKCFTNPWQVFDGLVVVATLTLELVFHFVVFSERTLVCVTYIVLLRLWRLPMLCNIHPDEAEQAGDYDSELYRSGRQKAEEKCRMLEHTVLQHSETIRKLERMLHNNTCSEQSGAIVGDCLIVKNGHPFNKTPDINGIQYKSTASFTARKALNSNVMSSPQKQSVNACHSEMETPFTITSQAGVPTSRFRLQSQTLYEVPHIETLKEDTQLCKNKIKVFEGSSKPVDWTKGQFDCGDGTTELHCLNNSETSLVASTQKTHISRRQRKRRSSASEIPDYSSIHSSDVDNVFCEDDKTSSCQSFGPQRDKLLSNGVQKRFSSNNTTGRDSENSVSIITGSRDNLISIALEEKTSFEGRRRTRRFLSCPEYVFTQRMSITNDESMLIDDGHAPDDHMVYSNMGFDMGENSSFQVVAEYDGTKTYRNQNGIPMTSL